LQDSQKVNEENGRKNQTQRLSNKKNGKEFSHTILCYVIILQIGMDLQLYGNLEEC